MEELKREFTNSIGSVISGGIPIFLGLTFIFFLFASVNSYLSGTSPGTTLSYGLAKQASFLLVACLILNHFFERKRYED